ncbi:hypothetical protein RCG23_08060 [Neobacillus sp. PS3-34]|uniref:hypothetical protein n=1 Tax=Neobacillus sp. PS3-34 TaxID=3070678 RepID=UPI0027DF233A|nr:hypothetical protein [Neobacillus sp. PS3-34]WML49840.1 hypothetical protein RCG23_08060 [Neobacillus sp. PS3-34]
MAKILSKKIPKAAMKTQSPASRAENGLHKMDEDRNAYHKMLETVFISGVMAKIPAKKIPKAAMKVQSHGSRAGNVLHKGNEDRNACH